MGNTQGSGSPPNSSRGRRRDRDSSWLNKSRTENRSGFLRQSSALSTTALNMLRNKDAQLKVVNQYRIVKQIGRGSFGEVFLATTRDGTRYAMKMLRKSALRRQRQGQFGSALDNVKAEIALMKKIRHPNCVQMIEVIDDESADEVFIILEFVDGGSSQATGRDGRQVPLKEGLIWSHLRHLVVGLEYLHMNGIAHRDIKPDNLLVSKREGNMLKIGDFGTALFTEAGDATKTAGTPAFFAPEMCDTEREGGFDPLACDMWAVGVTLHMWAYGRPPFSEPTPMLIMQAIRDCPDVVPQPQDERKVSEGLKSIMSGLLTKRPDRRLTLNLLRRHPWLTRDGAEPIPEQPIVIVEVSATDVANAITPLLQVSGHEGAVERDGAASIVKQTTVQEKDFYEALAASDIAAFAPVLYGIKSDAGPADFHIREEAPEGGAPIRLSIQDLTAGMQSPCVMDVKMGVRTTLEEELADDFPRPDLLRKMDSIDPRAATPAERQAGGITKARYLQFRDSLSSTSTLGFRVDAAMVTRSRGKERMPLDFNFRELKEREDIKECFVAFFQANPVAVKAVLLKVEYMRQGLNRSAFFKRHALVRSSILITYDHETLMEVTAQGHDAEELISITPPMLEAKMIAFAHSHPVQGRKISHREPWTPGSHEDGYLTGLDSLIDLLKEVHKKLSSA